MHFDWNFTEVCYYGSNQQYSSIGSDNDLAPTSLYLNQLSVIYWRMLNFVSNGTKEQLKIDTDV